MSETETNWKTEICEKSGKTESEIDELINIKIRKIGEGFINEKNAAALVAADLGVTVSEEQNDSSATVEINELSTVKNANITGRVLAVGGVNEFVAKNGNDVKNRSFILVDATGSVQCIVWGDYVDDPLWDATSPGDALSLSNVRTRRNERTGMITVSLTDQSIVENATSTGTLPTLESLVHDVGEFTDQDGYFALSGTLSGQVIANEWNKNGRSGRLLKLSLGAENGNRRQIILWNRGLEDIPARIAPDARITIYGLQTNPTNQDLYGNETTSVRIDGEELSDPISVKVHVVNTDKTTLAAGTSADGTTYTIRDTANALDGVSAGDVISIQPDYQHGTHLSLDENSVVEKNDADVPFEPVKLASIQRNTNVFVECVILKDPAVSEVNSKGRNIRMADCLVGDDTTQCTLRAWEKQVPLISDLTRGSRVSLDAVSVRGFPNNRVELTLTPYSGIRKTV